MTEQVSEGSVAYVEATFKDRTGALVAPASARYRVDCRTTGTALVVWTAISGVTSVQLIEIGSTVNAMVIAGNDLEVKTITVEATYNANDKITSDYDYFVKNLRNYP